MTARRWPRWARWLAAALSAAVPLLMCALLLGVERAQRASVTRTRRAVAELRLARIDLGNGLLHLMLSDEPGSPFLREVGLALVRQALDEIDASEGAAGSRAELLAASDELRAALELWRRAPRSERAAADLRLRLAVHALERLAQVADVARQRDLRDLEARTRIHFLAVLGGAMGLLNLVVVAGYVLGRRHGAALRALQESDGRFRTLFEQAGDGLLIVDAGGVYREANDRALELFGVPRDALVGRAVGARPGGIDDATLAQILARLEAGATLISDWQPSQHARGAVDVEVCARLLTDGRALVVLRDLSERRRAAIYAAAHQEITQDLAESISLDDGVTRVLAHVCARLSWTVGVLWLREPRTGALRCAAVWHAPGDAEDFARCTRASPVDPADGLVARTLAEAAPVWAPEVTTSAGPRMMAAREAGLRSGLACPVVSRGDIIGIFELYGAPPRAPDAGVLELVAALGKQLGQFLERQSLEEQVLQAQKLEAIGTLAGGIAHDFNNILTAILSLASLAHDAVSDNPQAQEDLAQIIAAGHRATAVVRQILTFSRQQTHEVSRVQVSDILNEVSRLLRATLPSTLAIELGVEANLPTVQGDANQLHQVLMNLGTNAWHAMRDRQGVLTLLAERTAVDDERPVPPLQPGDYVRITVRDNGIGMDEAVRRRVFEPFFTTKPQGEGTGLGLAVVHGIVHAHGGTIAVESEPGVGTAFHVWLPAVGPDPTPLSPPARAARRGEGRRVLLVDDEPMIVRATQRLLEGEGYFVESHTESDAALARIERGPDDLSLVITDLTLPGLSGLELARRAHEARPRLPVLLTTGYAEGLSEARLRGAHVDALLLKPASREDLLRVVDQVSATRGRS